MKRKLLNGVRIAIHDEKHCSDECPLFVAEQGTCILLKGTKWCLGYDRYGNESLLAEGHYLRCKKCRRLEAREAKQQPPRVADFVTSLLNVTVCDGRNQHLPTTFATVLARVNPTLFNACLLHIKQRVEGKQGKQKQKVAGVRPLDFEMFLEWCRRHDTLVDECPIDVSKLELREGK